MSKKRTNIAFDQQWSGKIVFGAGKLDCLPDEAKTICQRIFFVTTPQLSSLGLTERVSRILKSDNLLVGCFEDVEPNPTCHQADELSAQVRQAQANCILAVGGGSAIDIAKVAAVGATHKGRIWDYMTYTGANPQPICPDAVLPIIAVPTTAGTGSEVSMGAIIDNPELGMKGPLLSRYIIPKLALIDPELTYTLPAKVTAASGFDAMTHGIEAFLNVERQNYASDMFALEAVRLVADNLPRVMANPNDCLARERLCWAAYAGGMSIAIGNAGPAHAMAMPAGARLHLSHGLLLSRIQPVVLAHSWEAQPQRCAVLAEAAGAASGKKSERDKARGFAPWLREFVQQIGLADEWELPALDEATFSTLANDVFEYMARPIRQHRPVFTRSQIRGMFEESFADEE